MRAHTHTHRDAHVHTQAVLFNISFFFSSSCVTIIPNVAVWHQLLKKSVQFVKEDTTTTVPDSEKTDRQNLENAHPFESNSTQVMVYSQSVSRKHTAAAQKSTLGP